MPVTIQFRIMWSTIYHSYFMNEMKLFLGLWLTWRQCGKIMIHVTTDSTLHLLDKHKLICTLQKSDQYIISAENTVKLSHPNAAILHSTLTTFSHKNYENSYFYHNSTVPKVTASTAQHCMGTNEKFLRSTCLLPSPYFPSIPVTVYPWI
jgi:hypothetical protein